MGLVSKINTQVSLYRGASLLHDKVASTMGPKGRDVLIRNKYGQVNVTHDGISVAKAAWHENKAVQNGIELLRDGGKGMNGDEDGSTTVVVLAHSLIKRLRFKSLFTNPMALRTELDALVPKILDVIDVHTTKIAHTKEAVYDVTRTSAKDDDIARVVTEMVVGTGYKGAITVETQIGVETSAELVDGYLFYGGFTSKLFITDAKDKAGVLRDPLILLVNGRVENLKQYAQFINECVEADHNNILIIGDDIDQEILNTLLLTKAKSPVNATFVKNPLGFDYLKDLEAVTGAQIYNPRTSNDAPNLDNVGQAEKAIVKESETLIIGGNDTTQYCATLDEKTEAERISLLTGKIGHIIVGGVNETQVKERKDRVDDAIGAARAALKGGVVPGAGTMLASIPTGNRAVDKALKAPYFQLLRNAGIKKYRFDHHLGHGINVMTGREVFLQDEGIMDAAIITKDVVINAFAVAGTFLTVGDSINEKEMTQQQIDALLKM